MADAQHLYNFAKAATAEHSISTQMAPAAFLALSLPIRLTVRCHQLSKLFPD
ncbi:MAG: hypothetical protein ACLR3O_00580 [Streptococcus sp.]